MRVALATAWSPRGEGERFRRFYSLLKRVYGTVVVSVPPDADAAGVDLLRDLPDISVVVTPDWGHGRYLAVYEALKAAPAYVHYVDGDRLLRWVETQSAEWELTVEAVCQAEFLVIGRTLSAWQSHPQALRDTEAISNMVFSQLLGRELDLSAGSKGMRHDVAACLMANTRPGQALGTDAEWVVLAHRAGYRIEQILVDGLDWESADRYQPVAADAEAQREASVRYDADATHWSMRVAVAREIVAAGLAAWQRPLK